MRSGRRRCRRAKWRIILGLIEGQGYPDLGLEISGTTNGWKLSEAGQPLDDVVAGTLRLEVLEGWQQGQEVTEIRRVLAGGGPFDDLKQGSLRPLPGPKSSLTAEQVQQLLDMGVLRRKARREVSVNVCKAFTVPKSNGTRRLVVDASMFGEAMEEPPPVSLPSIDNVKQAVEHQDFLVQLDGRSWFYQVPAAEIGRFFALRTVLGVCCLVVLAMGWSWSVHIAQVLAQVLMNKAVEAFGSCIHSLVYIDNFLLFAKSGRDLVNAVAVLKRRARESGVVFKAEDHFPVRTAQVLGMQVDMEKKTVRLRQDWVDRLQVFWRVYRADPSAQSLRVTWKLFGALFWAMRVLEVPQYEFPNLKHFLSRRARELSNGIRQWGHKTVWWKGAWKDVSSLVARILENEEISVKRPRSSEWTDTVWTDASGQGGGYVLQEQGIAKGWRWSEEQRAQRIHVLEAWAMLRGIRQWKQVRCEGAGLRLMTDSTLVFFAMRSKKATGFVFSGAVADLMKELEGISWSVEWVPSEENLADGPSRGY